MALHVDAPTLMVNFVLETDWSRQDGEVALTVLFPSGTWQLNLACGDKQDTIGAMMQYLSFLNCPLGIRKVLQDDIYNNML